MKILWEGTIIPKKIQYTALFLVACAVVFITGIAIGTWTTPEDPKEVLKLYEDLHKLSSSIDGMAAELRELDDKLAENWFTRNREELYNQLQELNREYQGVVGKYNTLMGEDGYRFADPTKLPPGAKFGKLPKAHPVFILAVKKNEA